jgi:hypothetical protein
LFQLNFEREIYDVLSMFNVECELYFLQIEILHFSEVDDVWIEEIHP